ncbi:hypothetical protein [Acinetobacter bereziniae]|uniref:hypothetical protein n=1 Tax=Acinetobacter bereziniae TaxID=106648 RepID=UPI003008F4E8
MEKDNITEIAERVMSMLKGQKEYQEHVESEEKHAVKPDELKKILEDFQKRNDFQVGDLVQWKGEIFKNRHYPLVDQVATVVEVLASPVPDNELQSMSPAFGVKYDIVLGMVINGSFHTFYYESQRFKKYEE